MKRTPMKRTTPLRARAPMRQPIDVELVRKLCRITGVDEAEARDIFARVTEPDHPMFRSMPQRKSARKRSRKTTPARQTARGEDCTLCFPGCPNERDTAVLCHLRMFGGGGMGIKPDDAESVIADRHCHDLLDGRMQWVKDPPPDFNFWEHIARAIVRTQRVMRAKGVLVFKGEAA